MTKANRLYQLLIGDAVSEYRLFRNRLHSLKLLKADLYGETVCPACSRNDENITVCMDGNFGLVRKKNAGTSPMPPDHDGIYFVPHEEVNDFCSSYYEGKEKDQECSNFLAGNVVRSRAKNANLDIRGVFGSVCRHELPLLFMDMKYGERLAYSVLLMQKITGKCPNIQRIHILYDIACLLSRHLQKKKPDGLEKYVLGIPVFHAYGHGPSCQVKYGVRRLDGFGLTDGEGTERLWSYLRPLSAITKEMTPSHRTDVLTDALLHYRMKKLAGLAKWFDQRMNKSNAIYAEAAEKLQEIMAELKMNSNDILKWIEMELKQFEKKGQRTLSSSSSNSSVILQEKYVLQLQTFYAIRQSWYASSNVNSSSILPDKVHEFDLALQRAEKKLCIVRWTPDHPEYIRISKKLEETKKRDIIDQLRSIANERAFLVSLLAKYCDGQQIATKLSRQVTAATNKLKKLVKQYNDFLSNIAVLPQKLELTTVIDISSSIYQPNTSEPHGLPANIMQKAVEHYYLMKRAEEEKSLLCSEMRSCIQYYSDIHSSLLQTVDDVDDIGLNAIKRRRALMMEELAESVINVAKKYDIADLPEMPHFLSDFNEDDLVSNVDKTNMYSTNIEGFDYSSSNEDSDKEDDCDEDNGETGSFHQEQIDAALQVLLELEQEQ